MRVLTSNHRNLYQLAFSWDGAFLFATSCDDRWDERGVNSWELGCDSRSKVIGTGSLRATDFAPLPDGKLCVGGLRRFDEGYPFVPVQVVLDPTDPDSRWELPRCDPPTHVAVSPTGDRCVVRGGKKRRRVETLYSFRLPLAPIAEAEWAAKIVPLKGGVLPWFVGYGFDSTGERLWSVERMFFWGGQPERWVFRWRSAATGKVLGRLTPVPEMALFGLTLACKDTRLVGFEKAEIHVVDLIDDLGSFFKECR